MELQDYVTRTYPEDSYRSVGFTSVLHCASSLTLVQNCSIFSKTDLWWHHRCTCHNAHVEILCPHFPLIALRLSKLLLRLPALRLISAAVTEELFFAGLIGNVQIDSIIPYILKMESTDYNSQAVSGVWHTVPFLVALLDCENSTANQSECATKWSLSGHNILYLWHSILWEFCSLFAPTSDSSVTSR